MFLSKITRILTTDDDGARLTELATKVGRFQYALNGLIIVGFALVGREFISLWIGESFSEAYYGILLVLIPGLLFNSLQIFHTAMIAQNMVRYQAFIQIIMGVCNVGFSFVLSYFFGVIGACLSIFIAYMIRLLLTIILINKKLKINLWDYIKNCYLKMTLPVVVTGAASFFLIKYIEDTSWTLLVAKALLIIAIYAVAVCILGLTKQEKRTIYGKLFRKKTQS
jgi:O-antigen/teichoic acid export membrane protein